MIVAIKERRGRLCFGKQVLVVLVPSFVILISISLLLVLVMILRNSTDCISIFIKPLDSWQFLHMAINLIVVGRVEGLHHSFFLNSFDTFHTGSRGHCFGASLLLDVGLLGLKKLLFGLGLLEVGVKSFRV